MGVKQQKRQAELAFMSAGEVKPKPELEEGTETPTAGSKAESQAGSEKLMEVRSESEAVHAALTPVRRGNRFEVTTMSLKEKIWIGI